MGGNTYYSSDTCKLPDLEKLFKDKPHLEVLLEGRRWARVRARIERVKISCIDKVYIWE